MHAHVLTHLKHTLIVIHMCPGTHTCSSAGAILTLFWLPCLPYTQGWRIVWEPEFLLTFAINASAWVSQPPPLFFGEKMSESWWPTPNWVWSFIGTSLVPSLGPRQDLKSVCVDFESGEWKQVDAGKVTEFFTFIYLFLPKESRKK